MRLRTRVATAVATVPLVVGVAGCGGGQQNNTGRTPSAPAVSTSAPPRGAPAVAHLTTASFLPVMKAAMSTRKSLKVTMRMTVGGKVMMTMSAVETTKPVAMAMNMTGNAVGGKGRVIIVNGIVYLSMKSLTPAGKFLKIDPKNPRGPLAAGIGPMLGNMDPAKTFQAFDVGLRKVRFVRAETIDGRRLDRYDVTVDTAAALKILGQKVPAQLPKTIDYTLWMGSDHLMHRMAFDLAGIGMVMNTSNWGQPVTIEAPPARDIVTR